MPLHSEKRIPKKENSQERRLLVEHVLPKYIEKTFRASGQRLHKRAVHFCILSSYKNRLRRSLVCPCKRSSVAILNRGGKSHLVKNCD